VIAIDAAPRTLRTIPEPPLPRTRYLEKAAEYTFLAACSRTSRSRGSAGAYGHPLRVGISPAEPLARRNHLAGERAGCDAERGRAAREDGSARRERAV
jgi:hypothetical protein